MEDILAKDLQRFRQYEKVANVFISKLFRAFDFAAFTNAKVVQSVCAEDLIITEINVHTPDAECKHKSDTQLETWEIWR
ncbi:rCG61445 [Rattus norvegicus]|uniref:RCG61445 n=1 Tax=Rattus norvegicus TaxID=10116 RepID=A6HBP5_RAT|nr:rCG61445 [Rattus norvegicus]